MILLYILSDFVYHIGLNTRKMGSNNMDHSSKDNCLEEHLIKPTNGSDEAAGC